MWAGKEFPEIASVFARGVQHFSKNHSKNSADIALAMDAIADIVLGRVSFIAVVSDDSDFISLYCKLRDEKENLGYVSDNTPFLWVLTDRPGTRSDTVNDFFPATYTHVVPFPKSGVEASPETTRTPELTRDSYEDMAIAIIRNIHVGRFKSTDCREIIQAGGLTTIWLPLMSPLTVPFSTTEFSHTLQSEGLLTLAVGRDVTK